MAKNRFLARFNAPPIDCVGMNGVAEALFLPLARHRQLGAVGHARGQIVEGTEQGFADHAGILLALLLPGKPRYR